MDQTRKVVINATHGGFGLSRAAFLRLRELGQAEALAEADIGEPWADGSGPRAASGLVSFGDDIPRDDPLLARVVEEMGEAASGPMASLKVVEIPVDVEWEMQEYDGAEWIAEKHRTWA